MTIVKDFGDLILAVISIHEQYLETNTTKNKKDEAIKEVMGVFRPHQLYLFSLRFRRLSAEFDGMSHRLHKMHVAGRRRPALYIPIHSATL